MKSIRLSLMVYFLGLLALALGAASWFVYDTARATLEDKQRTTKKMIDARYKELCSTEEKRMDDQLLLEAQNFYNIARYKINRSRLSLHDLNVVNVAGLYGSQSSPNLATTFLWYAGTTYTPPPPRGSPPRPFAFPEPRPLSSDLYRKYLDDVFRRVPAIQFNDDELMHDENYLTEYLQIDSSWGSSFHSHALEENALPHDPSIFDKNHIPPWKFDEVALKPGVTVRRVVYKESLSVRFFPSRQGGARGAPTPPTAPAGPSDSNSNQRPALYIQCAYNMAIRELALKEFTKRNAEELNKLDEETTESLSQLRRRLFLISAATFAATVVGTWFLVWLGLMPLRRLSDAVSRVSEKDFRLQINGQRLPRELRPIVAHLANTLDLLKRAFAREKQATADISHELRTPLAAMLMTTELALRKPRSAEEYRELIEECRLSGQQINRTVERLLALARLDAGVDTMRPERVDVARLAEQCAALVRPLAEARGVTLRVHGSDGAQLLADPDKLREVITNLLHNAIEYNRPEGRIDVSVARQNGHLHVEVRDTGIGIKQEAKEHIFERFYRADAARGGDDGLHAGLGLAIVKGYVDLMGGTIHVDSAEGQGSTFHLELPVDRARSAADIQHENDK